MALKIRLRRMGRKKAPTYRLVVAESSMPRDGRFVENLGHYNPRTEPLTLVVDREKTRLWLGKGAVPTDTALALLKKAGVFRDEPNVLETATAAVTSTAAKASRQVKKAAAQVAEVVEGVVEDVREAVEDVVEEVRDAVEDAVEEVKERVAGEEGDGAAGEKEKE